MSDDSTTTTLEPSPPESPEVPIAEAIVTAMQATAHQYAAAQGREEDAPQPTVGRLPFPRPAFDLDRAWRHLTTKRVEVKGLAAAYRTAESRAKSAKKDMDKAEQAYLDARAEYDELFDRFEEERHNAAMAALHPEEQQTDLPVVGKTPCAWERANPGQVCHACRAVRENQLTPEESDRIHANAEKVLGEAVKVGDEIAADEAAALETDPGPAPPEEPEFEVGVADPIPGLQVGSVVISKIKTGISEAGERGVCYELYALKEHVAGVPVERPGYSFIFENGLYDGFAPLEVRQMLDLTGEIVPELAGYQFTNVVNLMRDFRKGFFNPALKVKP